MKEKVLLCWNYERKNWVSQFEEVFEDHDYCFLNFFSKEQEKANFSKVKVHYWEDFENVDKVLSVINPKIVVFMGLEGPYNLLLNYVCKQRKIPTYFMQHGIFHSYDAYKFEERTARRHAATNEGNTENKLSVNGKKTFVLKSFAFSRIPIFLKIAAFLAAKKFLHSTQKALRFIAGENVQTDHYIVYTKYLSRIFVERDKVPDHKFIEVGNKEANTIINHILNTGDYSYFSGEYFLFIDEAFSGSVEYNIHPVIPPQKFNKFLATLAEYSRNEGKKLKVKLHPFSYSVEHFDAHPNIEFIKEANTTELISNCGGVFGFTSTLLIPALFVKSACIFKLNEYSHIHKAIEKMTFCKVLNFNNFQPEDIIFKARISPQVNEFIRYFLYKLDDKYMNRLKEVLLSNLQKA